MYRWFWIGFLEANGVHSFQNFPVCCFAVLVNSGKLGCAGFSWLGAHDIQVCCALGGLLRWETKLRNQELRPGFKEKPCSHFYFALKLYYVFNFCSFFISIFLCYPCFYQYFILWYWLGISTFADTDTSKKLQYPSILCLCLNKAHWRWSKIHPALFTFMWWHLVSKLFMEFNLKSWLLDLHG